jgi:hypothetical protein
MIHHLQNDRYHKSLLPYCRIALLPYCPIAVCRIALLPDCRMPHTANFWTASLRR